MGETITENTASLLSGYINAIRADTSINRESLMKIAQAMQSQGEMTEICKAQLQQLEQIARNTYATAQNTAMIKDIYDQFRKVVNGADSLKIR
jgi:precorrin-6B methylase 2